MLDKRRTRGRNSFIVPSKGSKACRTNAVGCEIDDIGSIAEVIAFVRGQKAPSGKSGFCSKDTIQLRRMPAGLVDLKRHLRAVENQSRFRARANVRRKKDNGF